MAQIDPRVSVVIPCHSEKRWDLLVGTVASALRQTPRPAAIVVVVDHNETLYEKANRELRDAFVLRNSYDERGVSGNRNTGVFHTDTPLIALLDDDVTAHPGWLAGLLAPFTDPKVCGTGGAIRPAWEAGRQPSWVPDEFLWAWGGSYTGMPTNRSPIRNVWSASMAFRREGFTAVGGFRVGFGKVGDRSRPEDTDLCLRISQETGGHWVYVPDAVIDHPVPADKATLRYFVTRSYNEGRGKVEMARLNPGRQETLESERLYLRRTLPRAIGRGLADPFRGKVSGLARAAAVVTGLGAAGFGGAVETVRGRRAQQPPVAAKVTE